MDRSFNRGYTDYFVNKRKEKIGSWDTPKSQGQYIGKVLEIKANGYVVENYEQLNNADGLYFINANGEADGAQINIIVNDVVVLNSPKSIEIGTVIYRNSDAEFNKLVEQEKVPYVKSVFICNFRKQKMCSDCLLRTKMVTKAK